MQIANWMQASGVAFGTSGARGLVTAMTDRVCFAYTLGFLQHLAEVGEFAPGQPVALAGDLRPSTPRILRACAAAIRHAGGVPVYAGLVPTPALCHYSYPRAIPSLMVTGSHIPADRNGIKFNRARGEILKPDEARMQAQDVHVPEERFGTDGALLAPDALPAAIDVTAEYVARYRTFFGDGALAGLRLGVYEHSAVGRDVLAGLLAVLGAEVIRLGRADTFIPVDTEAVRPEDIVLARDWVATHRLDALLTTDGDADRPLLADDTGTWLRGDVLGILAARFLGAASVTTPVSSNTALELAGFAADIRRTRIGSPFVIEAMQAAHDAGIVPAVGYEANGGFLLASDLAGPHGALRRLPTRDAVLPMLCALVAARAAGSSLSSLQGTLPARYTASDRLAEIPTDTSKAALQALAGRAIPPGDTIPYTTIAGELAVVDSTDGLRMTFKGGEIIHLRPSGNAPEMRVYVEADSQIRSGQLLAAALAITRTQVAGPERA